MTRETKHRQLTSGVEELETLVAFDFKVTQFSPYHFRVQDRLDIWPSSRKWYDRISHAKGTYSSLLELAHSRFNNLNGGNLDSVPIASH